MARRWRVEAIVCALAVAICVLAAWPFAETGMTDDFSYVRTAQVFAATGHIKFNGWASAMLGWQLVPAALLIKVFGFSFTIVRSTTLLAAMATAFLMQRTMVRTGINEWNATVGTLTLMLSPLMLPLSFNFLSDVWSFFSIMLCLYACLRALGAETEGAAMGWIVFAAVGNGLSGTTRQIAWLGLLVMVPSMLWLLRGRRRVFWVGVAAFVVGLAVMALAMHWFNTQPYTLPEPLKRKNVKGALLMLPDVLVRPALEIPMLMLPVLLMFAGAVRGCARRAQVALGVGLVFFAGVAVHLYLNHTLTDWLVPFVNHGGSLLDRHGMYTVLPTFGPYQPAPPFAGVPEGLRLLLAAATIFGLLFLMVSFGGRRRVGGEGMQGNGKLPWHSLVVVLVPFGLAYVCLLAPRGLANLTLDRYLLPLVMVGLFLAVRWYQDTLRKDLPVGSLVLVLVIAAGSVAAMHDLFAMYRSMLAAAAEMQAAGVPRDKIDGGFEYNGWTQILEGGFVHQEGIRTPPGVDGVGRLSDNICPSLGSEEFPVVKPEYSLSFDKDHCGGPSTFAPVIWKRWWTPHEVTLYIVKNPIIPGNHKKWAPNE